MARLSIFNYFNKDGSLVASGVDNLDEPASYSYRSKVKTEYVLGYCKKLYLIIQEDEGRRFFKGYEDNVRSARKVIKYFVPEGRKTIYEVSHNELIKFE